MANIGNMKLLIDACIGTIFQNQGRWKRIKIKKAQNENNFSIQLNTVLPQHFGIKWDRSCLFKWLFQKSLIAIGQKSRSLRSESNNFTKRKFENVGVFIFEECWKIWISKFEGSNLILKYLGSFWKINTQNFANFSKSIQNSSQNS